MTSREPSGFDYRVELVLACPGNHALLRVSRSTLPHLEHEGVVFTASSIGKYVAMTSDAGDPDGRMHFECHTPLAGGGARCGADVVVTRAAIEALVAPMWAPYARATRRVVWGEETPDLVI